MEINIRPCKLSDIPYIYDICLKTWGNGHDASNFFADKYMLGQYYAIPYLHYEIDTCFVVESNSIPHGYILSASSTISFNNWMNKSWLPEIRKFYPSNMKSKSDYEKSIIDVINKDCLNPDFIIDYPSHLHINLLPSIQRKGFGEKLVDVLINKLKEKSSVGLHFGVGADNKNAINFYKKTGFTELEKDFDTLFMGMKFI